MDSEKLVFLHLSDIHFHYKYSGGVFDLDEVTRIELERDSSEVMFKRFEDITGILVTGDIAYNGKKEEYAFAKEWLDSLCNKLGCKTDRIWIVPGNHDIDRTITKNNPSIMSHHHDLRAINKGALDGKIRELFSSHDETRELLYRPISAYNEFAKEYDCQINRQDDDGKKSLPYWEDDLALNDGSILRLRGINSTLVSDQKDDEHSNRMIVGRYQSLPPTKKGVVYLSLCHHPPRWLLDQDSVEQYLDSRMQVQLFGHVHKSRITPGKNNVRIIAGAAHPDNSENDRYPSYNFVSISVQGKSNDRKLEVIVYPRKWREEENKFIGDFDGNNLDTRKYVLDIEAWETNASEPKSDRIKVISEDESDNENSDPDSQKEQPKGRAKELLFNFLKLSHQKKVEICRSLGLIKKKDKEINDKNIHSKCFARAKEKNILDKLWCEVENAYGNKDLTNNPFQKEK